MITSSKYDPVCYIKIEGIKIYRGTTHFIKELHKTNIAVYQENHVELFTILKPSTLTAKGEFSNVEFMEEEVIDCINIPPGCNILKVGCNFGEIFNSQPPFVPEEKPKKK